jgi:SNF2 family DNA or RNA helicase
LSDAKEHFPELKLAAFYGDEITRWDALHRPAHTVVWATEQVADNIELLKQVRFDMCTFDESSKIKNYSTKIAQAARDLSVTIPSWYNLSATPAPNGKHEYYTQMMCLDPYVFSPRAHALC